MKDAWAKIVTAWFLILSALVLIPSSMVLFGSGPPLDTYEKVVTDTLQHFAVGLTAHLLSRS